MKSIKHFIRISAATGLLSTSFLITSIAVAVESAPTAPQPSAPAAQSAPANAAQHNEGAVYATVNGQQILVRDYMNAFNTTLRRKFYHGNMPEGKMSEVREEVLDQMVIRILLLEEAKKRGLTPDESKIAETIAGYEKQYASSAQWQQNREQLLPGLRVQLAEQSLLEQFEKSARAVPEVSDTEAKKFYESHQNLFTEPEKLHLSSILLTVDPSSPKAVWEKTLEEAKAIYARLQNGADFAETARLHSNGKEAEQGGDMGYVHRGMLPEGLEKKIDDFKIGVITEPISVLEGIAIFRLEDRRPAKLRSFADVTERARSLARREREEGAWTKLKKRLKSAAKIKILVNPAQPDGTKANP